MTLSTTDLCSLFGVAPATVDRWVRQGKIPSLVQAGRPRFRKKDIEKWAARQKIRLNAQGGNDAGGPGSQATPLVHAFENGGVYHDIPGGDKETVLYHCVEQMDQIPENFKQDVLERIKQREAAMSTGIGKGVAIPHSRDPLTYLPGSMIITCFPETPVAYDALDGNPVTLLFFLLSTSLTDHLPLLSALSGCIKHPEFMALMGSRPDLQALVKNVEALGV